MTNTLILRSAKVLSNPRPGTPVVPDLVSDQLWELDPVTLMSLVDGANIDLWTAEGVSPPINRTFNFQYPNWNKPTFGKTAGPNGAPAALFDGTQQLANGAGTVAQGEPLTYVTVSKCRVFANTQSRILSDTNHWLVPSPSGYSLSGTGTPAILSSNATTEWVCSIMVLDGPNSLFKVGNGPIIKTSIAVQSAGRHILGGNGATRVSVGLEGGLAFARAYTRAFNESDIEAMALMMKRRFNLT